ncbi:MAG TPA: ATP-binding protein [Magnetospirillaceae bacterium]|nr:ATP-binding protein [Magnetospirillaceae bacterium]
MRLGSLLFRILPLLLAVSVLTLVGVSALGLLALRTLYIDSNRFALSKTARALANGLSPDTLKYPAAAQAFCDRTARGTSFRVTLITREGTVMGDSGSEAAEMDNHRDRPEVRAALAGMPGFSLRRSVITGKDMLYVAEPVGLDGETIGVLQLSLSVPELRERMAPFLTSAVLGSLVLIGAVAFLAIQLGRRISRPIAILGETAGAWASGDFGRRVGRLDPGELDQLGRVLNAMAAELADRIAMDADRTRELGTILDSIGEAVVAVDESFRVRRANPAARVLSAREPGEGLEGVSLLEAFRNTEMQAATERCIAARERVEVEVTIYRGIPRYFYLCAAPLSPGPAEPVRGAVLVLNDTTRMRRLEQVRRDFVANVSHELRTPITLIKGFAETLLDPQVRASADAPGFLDIVRRNAERMEALIEDLLTLASLERPDAPPLRREPTAVRPLLEEVAASLEPQRAAQGSHLILSCPEGLTADLSEGLLYQAVLNLADNALKYSGPGARIGIEAEEREGFLEIRVRDDGPGIHPVHLPRIFERFYRMDRARSRQQGGTGLGLAIVRHIALAHGGESTVQSRQGSGSTFTIRLPMR